MKLLEIKKISKSSVKQDVYDFEVADDNHYILHNNVVTHNSMFPTREVGGGGGLKYAATNIILLSKAKDKDGTEVVGSIITCKNDKSRLTKENAKIKIRLTYETGLDPYYGLVDIGIRSGIFTNLSNKIQIVGTEISAFEKKFNNNPEKYFTEEILTKINDAAKPLFLYGAGNEIVEVTDDA